MQLSYFQCLAYEKFSLKQAINSAQMANEVEESNHGLLSLLAMKHSDQQTVIEVQTNSLKMCECRHCGKLFSSRSMLHHENKCILEKSQTDVTTGNFDCMLRVLSLTMSNWRTEQPLIAYVEYVFYINVVHCLLQAFTDPVVRYSKT